MDTYSFSGDSGITPAKFPLLFVLSGPSGVGKDAVLDRLKETSIPLTYIITMTTRPPREREVNLKHYNFVSEDEFKALIENDGLLEWANVYGNWYGVPQKDVEDALSRGEDVIVKVDIQGVENILRKKPDAITIFLMPTSLEELFQRLKLRNTESASSLGVRMKTALQEMKTISIFNYAVINAEGEIDKAVLDIKSIISAEKCRVRM
ncbi:MAG: guanylate kinase [Dehalococcoidales bacterium]|nr:guanylate kinase [Dehalococcoidales bacterium]